MVVDFLQSTLRVPRIETERVAEALFDVFKGWFSIRIFVRQVSQLTSDPMKKVCRLISLKQLFTMLYNPKSNGFCKRKNRLLKSMLQKMCKENPKIGTDIYLLFAYSINQSSFCMG